MGVEEPTGALMSIEPSTPSEATLVFASLHSLAGLTSLTARRLYVAKTEAYVSGRTSAAGSEGRALNGGSAAVAANDTAPTAIAVAIRENGMTSPKIHSKRNWIALHAATSSNEEVRCYHRRRLSSRMPGWTFK